MQATMFKPMQATIRKARPGDALFIARMADAATGGVAHRGWAAMTTPDGDAFAVGAEIAADATGWPSYATSWIAEVDGAPAGMLMGKLLPPEPEPMPEGLPAHLAPIFELHALAPDTFYIDILAVEPDRRGQGLGTGLIRFAQGRAGRQGLSLIVAGENRRARALYAREGFAERARRPILDPALTPTGDDWVLLVRPTQGNGQ